MKINKRFLFHLDKNGKMEIREKEMFNKTLAKFKGKDGWILLKSIYRERSIQENRYLFGVVIKILREETEEFGGWDAIAVYRWLEQKFLNDFPGGIHEWVFIKNLSTIDFEELMERIRQWASTDLGVSIPEPNEVEVDGEMIL